MHTIAGTSQESAAVSEEVHLCNGITGESFRKGSSHDGKFDRTYERFRKISRAV